MKTADTDKCNDVIIGTQRTECQYFLEAETFPKKKELFVGSTFGPKKTIVEVHFFKCLPVLSDLMKAARMANKA